MTSRGTQYWSSGAIPLIAPDLLGDIIASAADIAVVISDMGQILSVLINPSHSAFGRLDHWQGRDIREFLTGESVVKLDTQLKVFNTGARATRSIELNHVDGAAWEFPVRYSFHQVGPDGGLLLLGRDLRPIAEMQQQLIKAQLALERDYEAQRESETRLRVVMDETRDALAFVSQGTGRIVDLNTAAAMLLGDSVTDLKGAPFAGVFDGQSRDELLAALTEAALAEDHPPIELTAHRTRRTVRVVARVFRAAGERMVLCRFEKPEGGSSGSDPLAENLGAFYQDGVDAILFTDRHGLIQTANEAFLNLVGASQLASIKGRSFADFLARGSVDMKVLVENAARAGQMRMFATRMVQETGVQVPAEISTTWLQSTTVPAMVFVVRDTSRLDAMRGGVAIGEDETRPVMDLVGKASLKEIVAETADVVEKMCIETAVELTRNNRVAAAEMLGLSRQSLYVKLRKYGLLHRDD